MTVDFWLDRDANAAADNRNFEYLPYGTRSLRIRVRTESLRPPLRIRPQAMLPAEFEAGIFRGYEDGVERVDGANFELSWGGGHEMGPCASAKDVMGAFEKCIELQAEEESVIIFNLTHIGRALPESAGITLTAISDSGELISSMTIELQRPSDLPAELAQFEKNGVEEGCVEWGMHNATHLALYETRWWPNDSIKFTKSAVAPPIKLRYEQESHRLLVLWQDETIAQIGDHTDPPIMDEGIFRPELFDFSEHYYALRLWFFWLDVNIGHGFFVGRHEVPDAERFDMLIRKKDGKVGLACTDLHWRESWGLLKSSPLEATIGLSRETKIEMAREQMHSIWDKLWGKSEKGEPERSYNPIGMVERLAKREATSSGPMIVRGKGTEAHVPMIHNMDSSNSRLTSSDVRLG